MKIKTAELIGRQLDWAVAKCEFGGADEWSDECDFDLDVVADMSHYGGRFSPSTDPAQAYPIIEQEAISTVRCNDLYFPKGNERGDYYEQYWRAKSINSEGWPRQTYGPTPLIAAMRCYCASKLGDTVEIPEELK